jgi:hypothetical protein
VPRWNVSARRKLDGSWGQSTEWPPKAFRTFVILTVAGLALAVGTFWFLVTHY